MPAARRQIAGSLTQAPAILFSGFEMEGRAPARPRSGRSPTLQQCVAEKSYFTSGFRAAGIITEATTEPASTVPMMPSEMWMGTET